MKLGFAALGNRPDEIVRLAAEAEAQGWHRIWFGDHLCQPVEQKTAYPYAETALTLQTIDYIDPLVQAAAVAAATSRIEIATGVFLLPMHHPLHVARALSTLQTVAAGRFNLGVGAGWMAEEFEALGIPFKARGKRMDESLEVLRLAQRGGEIAFEGTQFRFEPLVITHRAVPVPLIVGGTSEAAYRRAARFGDGWYSTPNFEVEDMLKARDRIEELRREHGTDGGPFRYLVRLSRPDPELLAAYEREGFDEFTVGGTDLFPRSKVADMTFDEKVEALRQAAADFGLAA